MELIKYPTFKFLGMFFFGYCALVIILSFLPDVCQKFTVVVTESAGMLLSCLGFVAEVSSHPIANNGYAELQFNSTIYRVNEDCTGLSLVVLVAAAVAAVPARWHVRFLGILAMSLIAVIIGCLRIVILGCVAEYHSDIFHVFHTYIMEVATIGCGLWILATWFDLTDHWERSSIS